ncbi:MAG: hypothetical protein MUC69_01405 [Gemmatimonadales bacterium]|jgi:hypothetical protein|nr:hypothetical protein [Gemmatimonadales bacterium]
MTLPMARVALLLALALVAVPAAGAQNALPPAPVRREPPSTFFFTPDASDSLRTIWARSIAERREHVACLGGEIFGADSVRVERVLPLHPDNADSVGVSAQASIDTCGPPLYHGTVHTHIALTEAGKPYERFSGADRGVMLMWWKRWHRDGMFCVLYSARDAWCEVDGESLFNMSRSAY